MKKSKFTESQILFALQQAQTGTPTAEVCRKIGVSEATFYNWKRKYSGLGNAELRRMRQLEGLNLRSKRPRRCRAGAHMLERRAALAPHQSWSMDFVADELFDGRRFRALTLVDNYSRRCLAIYADQSIKGHDVASVVEHAS